MAGHVSFDWVDAQLRAARSIWLATTRADGRAHVSPVWFTWDGRCVRFSIGPAAVKVANLAGQRYVELHLGDGDDVVVLRGTAERITAPAELASAAAAVRAKYVDPGSGARAELGELAYRVEVEQVFAWMYGVCGHRTDWGAGEWPGSGPV